MIPLVALGLALAAPAEAPARRLALVAGANDGGMQRARLRYATDDARSVADVLQELGGVAPDDVVLLSDPSVEDFRSSLAALGERANDISARRTEVVVYYSGHSDEQGLLLGEDRYGYVDLRADLDALDVDVRIAVLDSCSSGALVTGKGGVAVPAFLVDASSSVAGHAFLTSSSADEVSQEAGRIGGSFFTHALVSGLRGAADADLDARVTLQEAYDFAHSETLSRTEATQRGSQHPQYEFDLTGTGDLVITDLGSKTSGLRLPVTLDGRVHVWASDGHLAAELLKVDGRALEIGLPPGRYRVVVDDGDEAREGRVDLIDGQLALLDPKPMRTIPRTATTSRGGALQDESLSLQYWPRPRSENLRQHAAFGLVTGAGALQGASFAVGATTYRGEVHGWQSGLIYNRAGRLSGLQNGVVNHATDMDGMQLGVVNRSGSLDGLAFGFVNVAETGDGLPLGFLNIVRDGILDVEVWSGDLSPVNLSLKSGTRSFFTSTTLGYDPFEPEGRFSIGGAIGARPVWVGGFTADVDVTAMVHFPNFLYGESVIVVPMLRGQVGYDLHDRFGVFAGASLGGQVSMQDADAKVTSMPSWDLPVNETGVLRLHPGWFVGVRF